MGRILDRYERGDYERKQKEKFVLRVKEHAMADRAKARQQRKESHTKAVYTIAGIALFMVVSQALGPIRNFQVLEDFATSISSAAERLASEACPTIEKQAATSGKPIWVAGYPGSGSEMFRSLIEASTGLEAGNIYDGGCQSDMTVTCKTHWPLYAKSPPYSMSRERFYDNALLLIRNPANAIPSYFSDLWEGKMDLQSHTIQAPEDDWKEWRDQHFDLQIEKWKSILIRWTNRTTYTLSFYVPFEDMIDEQKGPKLLKQVLREFEDASFFVPIDDRDDISCIWRSVVKYNPSHLRGGHSYEPSFRPEHKEAMIKVIDDLQSQLSFRQDLVPILSMYRAKIESNLRLDLEPKRFEVPASNYEEDEYMSDELPETEKVIVLDEAHSVPLDDQQTEEIGDTLDVGTVDSESAPDTDAAESSDHATNSANTDFENRADVPPTAGDLTASVQDITATDPLQGNVGLDVQAQNEHLEVGQESDAVEMYSTESSNESETDTTLDENGDPSGAEQSNEEQSPIIPAMIQVDEAASVLELTSREDGNIESGEVQSETDMVEETHESAGSDQVEGASPPSMEVVEAFSAR